MTETIDHAALALTLRNNIRPDEMTDPDTANWLATAQVHATLALVEQQRLANLIALFTLTEDDSADYTTAGVSYPDIRNQIIEGLWL